jgi:2-polyprenyl-6-methoxyphenol hydroxylase-like FAD-dependent oxidoreductase
VFRAGDAAPVCFPAESHGMHCTLHDASNLARQLSLDHHGAVDVSNHPPKSLGPAGRKRIEEGVFTGEMPW